MTKRSTASLAAVAWLFGSLACAGGMAREDDTAAAQQDTTETEAPPGYSGMEQDTTAADQREPTAVDTFLNEQGTGVPADTMGYGGFEQPDTSGMTDTTSATGPDTSGWSDTTSSTGADTSGTSGWSDTTGTSSWDTTGQQ